MRAERLTELEWYVGTPPGRRYDGPSRQEVAELISLARAVIEWREADAALAGAERYTPEWWSFYNRKEAAEARLRGTDA